MAISGRRRIAIVGLIAALVVAGLGVANVRADPTPDLPSIGGDELLASTLGALARPFTISGDVDTHVDLGIPQIPAGVSGGSGGGLMGAVNLVAGDQAYKIWRSRDGARVAHLLPFAEQDVVVDPHDAWFWDSSDMSAIHLAGVPGTTLWDASAPAAAVRDADLLLLAQGALDAVAPYADVTVDGTARVAGRPAYQLVLTPTSTLTLVGRITVAIDAETRLPLRLQVFPRGSDGAAIEAGFTARVVRSDRPVDVRVHAASRHHGAPGGRRHRGRSAPRGRRSDAAGVRAARVRPRGSTCAWRSGWTRRSRPRRRRSFPTRARCCRRSPSNATDRPGCWWDR